MEEASGLRKIADINRDGGTNIRQSRAAVRLLTVIRGYCYAADSLLEQPYLVKALRTIAIFSQPVGCISPAKAA